MLIKRPPFYYCAIKIRPVEIENAVCTEDGGVFDYMCIIPYILKYGKHPVSGLPLTQRQVIPLTFHKNSQGWYHCPVLNTELTDFSHIVAIKTTGNVFSYEAIKEFNLNRNNWKEPLTGVPFKRKDIITLQDVYTRATKVVTDYDHVKNNLIVEDGERMRLVSEGDMQKMLKELKTNMEQQIALHGDGGSKTQNERAAAALATILAAREPVKDQPKPGSEVKMDLEQINRCLEKRIEEAETKVEDLNKIVAAQRKAMRKKASELSRLKKELEEVKAHALHDEIISAAKIIARMTALQARIQMAEEVAGKGFDTSAWDLQRWRQALFVLGCELDGRVRESVKEVISGQWGY